MIYIKKTARLLLIVIFALSAAAAGASEYDTKDVVAFNALIRNLGLKATPDAPETWVFKKPTGNNYKTWGQDPRDLDGFVVWSSTSPRRIKELWFLQKGITGDIDLSGFDALEFLQISDEGVTGVNVSKNTNLFQLTCYSKHIKKLDVSYNRRLNILVCEGCQLPELDLTNNPELTMLLCASNDIRELRLTNNPNLIMIDCRNNPLSELDLSLCPNLNNYKADSDVDIRIGLTEAQVRRAWSEVCRATGMDELPLKIEHKESPNAWVDARSNVTVTTSLMRILSKEEEIAGVLLHEASHAKLGHVKDKTANTLATLLIMGAIGAGIDSTAGWIGAASVAQLAMAGYSRQQEVEADDLATDLALENGLDPTGIYNALERLAIVAGRSISSGFSTHPPDHRRLGRIERRIHEADPNVNIDKLLGLPELAAGDDGIKPVDNIPSPEDEAAKERRERKDRIDDMMKELGM